MVSSLHKRCLEVCMWELCATASGDRELEVALSTRLIDTEEPFFPSSQTESHNHCQSGQAQILLCRPKSVWQCGDNSEASMERKNFTQCMQNMCSLENRNRTTVILKGSHVKRWSDRQRDSSIGMDSWKTRSATQVASQRRGQGNWSGSSPAGSSTPREPVSFGRLPH